MARLCDVEVDTYLRISLSRKPNFNAGLTLISPRIHADGERLEDVQDLIQFAIIVKSKTAETV